MEPIKTLCLTDTESEPTKNPVHTELEEVERKAVVDAVNTYSMDQSRDFVGQPLEIQHREAPKEQQRPTLYALLPAYWQ